VSRGGTLPWPATTVPEIRRQLRNAFIELMDNYRAAVLDAPPEQAIYTASQRAKLQAAIAKLDSEQDEMRQETDALDRAELFWVTRDMVPVAVKAAQTLPACYVAASGERQ
jgi:hypothetical protein